MKHEHETYHRIKSIKRDLLKRWPHQAFRTTFRMTGILQQGTGLLAYNIKPGLPH